MSVLFRRSFKIAIFSRLFKVAIATSSFMNEVYNGGFAPEFSVLMLKETIALVRDVHGSQVHDSPVHMKKFEEKI